MILASLGMIFATAANAQDNKVTLNVRLNPIQTLVVNAQQKIVNLDYSTTDHYANGVSSTQDNHLKVFSTGGFEVKVKSSGSELTKTAQGGNGNIDASTVKLTALAGTQEALANATYSQPLALSATEGTLVTSTKGAVNKNIGVKYEAAGANAYIDKYVAGTTPTVFTTELTYTIVAK